jgi:hypothetical protein
LKNTDAVAVVLVAANGVIDKMELSTGVFGITEKAFLAAYQARLAVKRTNQSEDHRFKEMLDRYFNVKAGKK